MKIIRGKLTPDDLSPPNLRYDSDCDCVQFSSDGGATWTDDPSDDPRSAPKFLLPAITGSDIQCRAAANMVRHLEDTLGSIETATSALQIASGLLAILLTFLLAAGIIFDLILAAAEAISSIGLTVVEAAFTAGVYDQIRCILFCHIDGTGRINATGLDAAQSEIDAACGSVVGDVFALFVAMWGINGFNNAGATGDAPHDCSECAICGWCYEWSSPVDLLADGWAYDYHTGLTDIMHLDQPMDLVKLEFQWSNNGIGTGGDSALAWWSGVGLTGRVDLVTPISGDPSPYIWTGTQGCSGVAFGGNAQSGTFGTFVIETLHLEGTGTHPTWTHGNEC